MSNRFLARAAFLFLSSVVASAFACGSDEPANGSSNDDDDDDADGPSGPGSGGSGATSSGPAGGNGNGASSSSGPGPGSGGEGGAGCSMGLGDACSDCAAMACNDLYCACYGNAACGALVACAANCAPGDSDCGQACLTSNQPGIVDALKLGNCAASSCASACPTATALSPCEVCALNNCPAQMTACVANEECTALVQCVQTCDPGDDFCFAGCAFDHGDGQDDAEALQACVENPCPECG